MTFTAPDLSAEQFRALSEKFPDNTEGVFPA